MGSPPPPLLEARAVFKARIELNFSLIFAIMLREHLKARILLKSRVFLERAVFLRPPMSLRLVPSLVTVTKFHFKCSVTTKVRALICLGRKSLRMTRTHQMLFA